MSRIIVTTCIVLFTCLAFVRTKVTVENGAYRNVLVSFSQNVLPDKGKILLEKLQDHLGETSDLLRNAINIGISEVTFVIPRSWDTSEWNLTVESHLSERDAKADILVDDVQNSVFGNFPFAQQHGSCGTPGDRIVVPSDFLTEADAFPKGTALAREWLKYRYGVFDENGYPGDELYPLYYYAPGTDPTGLTVTGCTNTPVKYNFYDSKGNNCTPSTGTENRFECRAKPEDESLVNVTSSLMYFHEHIRNMQHVCGKHADHPHSSRSRNKHNSLCKGKSIWEVLQTSSDFPDVNYSTSTIASEDNIQFNYVQEAKPRVVIAWENNRIMKNQGDTVLKAIRKFTYDLPKYSKYALFPYTEKIATDKTLHELVNWLEDWRSIQIRSDFVNPKEACLKCAIENALDILASDNSDDQPEPVGTAIIVASNSIEADEDQDLLQRLQNSKVCLLLLVFSDGAIKEVYQKYAGASSCGALVEFSHVAEKKQVFEKLLETMESILPERVDNKVTETVKIENIEDYSPISFPVDAETAEKVTIWILREELFKHTEAESVEATIDGKLVDLTEEKTSDILTVSFSPKESGNVEFKLAEGIKALVQIRVTSKPGNYIIGEVLSQDTTEEKSEAQMPVILYARVHYGSYPVQNAEVSALISRPDEEPVEFEMYDNGIGDPDITANDGVYSGYFIDFSEKGEYSVTVTVKNGDEAKAGKLETRGDYKSCCGSKLEMGTVQLPSLTKEFKTTFESVSGRPKDGYQPTRILDLRVVNMTDDKVVLKWTAPGEEADKRAVASYDIKYFATEEDLLNFENGKSLNSSISPQESGLEETFEVDYSQFENRMLIYIAIKSMNAVKITSDISNIIEVFIPDTQTTTVPGEEERKNISKGSVNKTTVGIIIAIILGIIVLLIIIYAIVYFTVLKPKRKREKKEIQDRTKQLTDPTVQSHQLNPVNSVSVDTLIRHHNEKERAKSENKPQRILKEEDFEDRAAPKKSSMEQPEYTEVQRESRNVEAMPTKSPKRTSNV